MKRISRAMLRGKPLEPFCKKANTTSIEYSSEENRVYCYGLYQNNICGIGDWIADCCEQCKAYIDNITPLEKENK